MKRDLRINYANLKYIQRQLIQYVEEIRVLSAAANVFLAVMQAQDSEAYKKLRKHWNDKVIDNASMLSGRLEQVAENLGGYISAMTTYIAPVDESREMRVDRNDIWFNYIQIGMNTRDYWDIFGDRGSSWDNYRRWFCYNPFESEEANNNRRNRMRSEDDAESSRRKGNYDKLQSFRDRMFRRLSVDAENHIGKIRDIHQNNVIPYENMDDEYNKKLHGLYKEWATLGDVIRDNWNESVDFYRGAFKAVVDLVGGIAGLLWNLTEMQFYPTLQLFGIVPKWMQNDMDRLEQTVILLFTDPGQAVETIGQNIFDTADEEGIAFSAGYVIVDIAVEILVSKGLDKLKAAKMADDIVDVAGDVAKYADDVVDAAEDLTRYADDVVDAVGDLTKYADDVVDAAGDLTKYADDVVDAAGDLTKYADNVADTAEDLVKHADEVADAAEDLVKHAEDVVDAAGDLPKHTDDVVDTAENLVKHADEVADTAEDLTKHVDDVVDTAGDLTRYADDVVDAAGDLTKYADNVADTAEDLVKHADEVADTAEDLAGHVDDLDGIPGKTEGVREQGIEGGTGSKGTGEIPEQPSAKGLIGKDFEDYLHEVIGGESKYIKGSNAGRDFDGVVGNRWYEAKSGNYWNTLLNDKKVEQNFKRKMVEGLRIAQENGATYELFSNSPIPDSIKEWLTKKGIPFTEILY